MLLVYNPDERIIVDELDNKGYSFLNGEDSDLEKTVLWTFPSKEIRERIGRLFRSKYTELDLTLFHLIVDTGGGDEVSLKVYGVAKSPEGRKVEVVSGWINALLENFELISMQKIMEIVDERLDALNYLARIRDKIYLQRITLKKIKELGINLSGQGRLSEEDLAILDQMHSEGKI